VLAGSDFDGRVQQTGGTDDLFNDDALRLLQFIITGSGTDIQYLLAYPFEFVKIQRPVIDGGRQTKTVLDQVLLSGPVTAPHGPDLR